MGNSKLVCLFAHFNAINQVDQYVITYLQHLEITGFEIIFISNSPIKPEYRNLLKENTRNCKVFERENRGIDFGAWQWAMENNLVSEDIDYVLLTNDSFYGPLFPLAPIIESMHAKPEIDFWGMTDSYQGKWHLQSYFLLLSKKVFISGAFKEVFKQDFSEYTKRQVIHEGEMQLAKSLSGAGFKGMAYIPYDKVNPGFEEWDTKNPTHFFWDYLIEKFNFPFIKKELILQNPENIQSTGNLFSFIRKISTYPIQNIKESISNYIESFNTPVSIPEKVSVICHLFYPASIWYFLTRIIPLKSSDSHFIFNLSHELFYNDFFRKMLAKYFPEAIVLYTPNQGRDIGGKLAAFDSLMKCGFQSDYSLIIHDKLSPHTPTGVQWRNKLLKIIQAKELTKIFIKFNQDKKVGVITVKEFIQNEFEPERNKFSCTSSANILHYITRFNLNVSEYDFAAGTIFWIRTEILRNFFSLYSPLSIRKDFEKGNAVDFDKGTNIHAWERLFSFIANSQGFKTFGI